MIRNPRNGVLTIKKLPPMKVIMVDINDTLERQAIKLPSDYFLQDFRESLFGWPKMILIVGNEPETEVFIESYKTGQEIDTELQDKYIRKTHMYIGTSNPSTGAIHHFIVKHRKFTPPTKAEFDDYLKNMPRPNPKDYMMFPGEESLG